MSLESLAKRLVSWEEIVLKIDGIEIEGVERSSGGVLRFKDEKSQDFAF